MTEAQPTNPPQATASRVPGESRYPNYDLNSCIAVAEKVKNEGTDSCTAEQLGALLGYTYIKGGGFATRVANAKQFGLIEVTSGNYHITTRADHILYPTSDEERQHALADAFLSVPLYRRIYEMHKSTRLPEGPLAMQNLLKRLGVPGGDRVALALRVFFDSADQAGFFKATQGQKTKLTMPIIMPSVSSSGDEAPPNGDGAKRTEHGGGGNGSGGSHTDRRLGKLVDGVWEMLPETDTWEEPLFQDWLKLLTMSLRVRYQLPTPRKEGQ
jgi:hypothetical protein